MRAREIYRQLVRAAMGASDNLEEADEASSATEFVCKLKIALREVKEAGRWLRLVRECDLDRATAVVGLEREAGELAAIYAAIVLKVKRRLNDEREARARKPRGSNP